MADFGSIRVLGDATVTRNIKVSGQIKSLLPSGTAPFVLVSNTLVTNLNSDLLDGQHGSYYLDWANLTGKPNYIINITPGVGLTISGTGGVGWTPTLSMGTPSTLTTSTTNSATGTTHTHQITTASANTASTIVARDGSGNFSAGTITAALSGNASTATKWETTRTITLTGGVTSSATNIDGSGNVSIATTLAAHAHGNITNAGYLGSTANLPIITGTGGILQAGSFGTTANTFCQGNDSRLSDARTPVAHAHGNITNGGAIGTTSGLMIQTTASGVLTTLAAGTTSQYLRGDGVWGTPPDLNYYPTTFTWTNGTTAGATGSLSGVGMSAVTFAALPSASATISGVVTTGDQTFAGNKIFSGYVDSRLGIAARSSATTDGIALQGTGGGTGTYTAILKPSTLTGDKIFYFPDATGTVALVRYNDAATALTGSASVPANGELLIGDGVDYTRATLTAGTNISITNAAGSITINSSLPSHTHGNIANNGTIGTNATPVGGDYLLISDVSNSNAIQRGTQLSGNTSQYLNGNGAWSTPTDTNYYPTTFAWTNGTTSGPTGSLTGTGMSAVSFGAIPAASGSASGIVTTDMQVFKGMKIFKMGDSYDGVTILGRNGGADGFTVTITPSVLTDDQVVTLPNATGIVALVPIRGTSVTVLTSAWVADTTYPDYGYRASIAISGVTNTMIPHVYFNYADSVSGIYSTFADTYNGGVYIYASEIPSATVTIPLIECVR